LKIRRFNESSGINNDMIFIKNLFMEIEDFCEDNNFTIKYYNPVINNYKVWVRLTNLDTPTITNAKSAQEVIKFTEAKLEILKKLETVAKRAETNPNMDDFWLKHNATVWKDSSWYNEDLMTFEFNFNTPNKADNVSQILKQEGDHLNWNGMELRRYMLDKYGINTYYAGCTTEENDYSEQGLTIEYNKIGTSEVKLDQEKVEEFKEEMLNTGIFTHFSEHAPYESQKALYFTFHGSIFSADYDGNQRFAYLEN